MSIVPRFAGQLASRYGGYALNPYVAGAITAIQAGTSAYNTVAPYIKSYKKYRKTAKKFGKDVNTLAKYIPNNRSARTKQKNSQRQAYSSSPKKGTMGYKRKRSYRMPPTPRQAGRRRRIVRRRRKANKRHYKRKARYRSKLRGLVGPQCVPKTAFCRLRRKINSGWNTGDMSTALWFHKQICGTNFETGTDGIRTGTTFPIRASTFTMPFMYETLLNMFNQMRIVGVVINLKIRRLIPSSGTPYNDAIFMALVKHPKAQLSTVMATQMDKKVEMQLNPRNVIRIMPRIGATTTSIPEPTRKFKTFVPPFLYGATTKREFYQEKGFAHLITGDLGSRVVADPTEEDGKTDVDFFLTKFEDTESVWASETAAFRVMGTITYNTYWTEPNTRLNVEDDP